MKTNVMVKTINVKRADDAVKKLLNRPKTELVGLGLIYGIRGLGKSRYGQKLAYQKSYIYQRIEATDSPKSFLAKLYNNLMYVMPKEGLTAGIESFPSGTANKILSEVINLLHSYPNAVIVIDEFDNALFDKRLMETVRDIADQTFATLILIGMEKVKSAIEKANPHFFDRCNFFCHFEPLPFEDVKNVVKQVSDLELGEKSIKAVYDNCYGNIRKLYKAIELLEEKSKKGNSLDFKDSDKETIQAANNVTE